MFVLDNSVSAAWCFADQSNHYTDAVLRALAEGETAVVPALWRLEIVNSLVVAERRKKLEPFRAELFLREIQPFRIRVDHVGSTRAFGPILDLSRRFQRSAYDAAYLELAIRLKLPLATKDGPLRQAAQSAGVGIFLDIDPA